MLCDGKRKTLGTKESDQTEKGRAMFFLLKMVFWLAVAFALLPSGGSNPRAATPSAMSACGQAGLRMLHDVFRASSRQTRSPPTTAATRSPVANPSQGTLTDADIAPAWRGQQADFPKKHGA
jgi:hypothetical protein